MSLLLVFLLAMQGTAPLRKSDLVRLISGSAMSPGELAQLVQRNCLTFQPTDRDRSDFQRRGADRSLLAVMDDCSRRRTAPKVTPVAPVTRPAVVPRQPSQPPPTSIASAQRSGFVSGGGQRGSVGAQLPRALVFAAGGLLR